jgi:hypothetical protein
VLFQQRPQRLAVAGAGAAEQVLALGGGPVHEGKLARARHIQRRDSGPIGSRNCDELGPRPSGPGRVIDLLALVEPGGSLHA